MDQSGLNEIINDYDKYLKLSSNTGLKDTFRMNLSSRVANFKEKAQNREALSSDVSLPSESLEGSGDGLKKDVNKMKDLFEIKSIRDFKNALGDSGFREGADGFMVSSDGKSTGVKYRDVLNDFSRNVSSLKSSCLSDRDKDKVLNLLKKTGFSRLCIKNTRFRLVFNVKDISPDVYRSQILKKTYRINAWQGSQ